MSETSTRKKSGNRKRSLRRWVSRIVFALITVAIIAAIVMAWMPRPVVVETAAVRRDTLIVTVDNDGRTRVKDRYIVSAPLAGNLARIELQAGDRVKADSVVARLLPLPAPLLDAQSKAQAKARVSAADAALRQARSAESRAKAAQEYAGAQLERNRPLAKQGVITQQNLDRAEFDVRTKSEATASASFGVRVARHNVELARAALGRLDGGAEASDEMEVQSSVEGVVLQVLKQSEGVVQPGTPLLEIGDPTALEVVVDVLTTDAVRIEPGAKASILRWGGQGELKAHVARVEPKAFNRISSLGVEEQRVNVVLDLDSPQESWSSLGDGYRIEASIVVWEEQDVLVVPVSAVFRRDDSWTVLVVDGDVARLRTVEVGQRNGLEAGVVSGLETSDVVILHAGERVSDGTSVQPR